MQEALDTLESAIQGQYIRARKLENRLHTVAKAWNVDPSHARKLSEVLRMRIKEADKAATSMHKAFMAML